MRVLFVDDSTMAVTLMEQILEDAEFEFLTACNGKEAWQIIQNTKIDILLTDEEMPYLSGTELMLLVKKHFPDTYVVGISAHLLVPSDDPSLPFFDRVERKPVRGDIEELIWQYYKVLENRRNQSKNSSD